MARLLVVFVPALILVVMFAVVAGLVWRWQRNSRLYARQSPLARNLLRPPGQSLRRRIECLDSQIEIYIVSVLLAPPLLYSIHVSQSYLGGEPENVWRIGTSVLLGVAIVVILGRRLLRLLNERKFFALGLDGEMATGEELNQLMLDGCRVFHDVPIPYGNVDHVVVHHSGVYAVNTKLLGRLPENDNDAKVTIDYAQMVMRFPDRTVPIPVDQLMTEAKCLSDLLASAVGKTITVESMLALPGWFINRSTRCQPCVFNPRNATKFFVHDRRVFSDEVVKQIAHQLETLCRDVEPVFQEKKGWSDGK